MGFLQYSTAVIVLNLLYMEVFDIREMGFQVVLCGYGCYLKLVISMGLYVLDVGRLLVRKTDISGQNCACKFDYLPIIYKHYKHLKMGTIPRSPVNESSCSLQKVARV